MCRADPAIRVTLWMRPIATTASRLWNQSTEPRLILDALQLCGCDVEVSAVTTSWRKSTALPTADRRGRNAQPLPASGGRSSGSQFGEMAERVAQMLRRERRESDVLSDGVGDC